jgi:hypothetical protein
LGSFCTFHSPAEPYTTAAFAHILQSPGIWVRFVRFTPRPNRTRQRPLPTYSSPPEFGFVLHVSLPGRTVHDSGLCPHTPVPRNLGSFCTISDHAGRKTENGRQRTAAAGRVCCAHHLGVLDLVALCVFARDIVISALLSCPQSSSCLPIIRESALAVKRIPDDSGLFCILQGTTVNPCGTRIYMRSARIRLRHSRESGNPGMSLRGAERRSDLNPCDGKWPRRARVDVTWGSNLQDEQLVAHLDPGRER